LRLSNSNSMFTRCQHFGTICGRPTAPTQKNFHS
jgi:hypothetical protein